MSDFDIKNKVVQANDLIQLSKWNLNAVPLKVFKALVSCIDTKNPPKNNTVSITKQELFRCVGSSKNESYDYLKRQVKSLQSTIVSVPSKDGGTSTISLVPTVEWPREGSNKPIECVFHPKVMPYLIDMHELFLQYDVSALKNFDSKYGVILYEYLLSRERQERQSEHKYSISIENLRRLTDTETKFKDFKDLNKRVIEAGINDINGAGVEFLVIATNNGRRGVKTTHVEFTLRKRTSITETEFDVVAHPEWIHRNI